MNEEVKDFLGRTLQSGDAVVFLEKETCCSGLKDARLLRGFYVGETRWGSEFHIPKYDRQFCGKTKLCFMRTRLPSERVVKIILEQERE